LKEKVGITALSPKEKEKKKKNRPKHPHHRNTNHRKHPEPPPQTPYENHSSRIAVPIFLIPSKSITQNTQSQNTNPSR
jgi:hypothetical protein